MCLLSKPDLQRVKTEHHTPEAQCQFSQTPSSQIKMLTIMSYSSRLVSWKKKKEKRNTTIGMMKYPKDSIAAKR